MIKNFNRVHYKVQNNLCFFYLKKEYAKEYIYNPQYWCSSCCLVTKLTVTSKAEKLVFFL